MMKRITRWKVSRVYAGDLQNTLNKLEGKGWSIWSINVNGSTLSRFTVVSSRRVRVR